MSFMKSAFVILFCSGVEGVAMPVFPENVGNIASSLRLRQAAIMPAKQDAHQIGQLMHNAVDSVFLFHLAPFCCFIALVMSVAAKRSSAGGVCKFGYGEFGCCE